MVMTIDHILTYFLPLASPSLIFLELLFIPEYHVNLNHPPLITMIAFVLNFDTSICINPSDTNPFSVAMVSGVARDGRRAVSAGHGQLLQ